MGLIANMILPVGALPFIAPVFVLPLGLAVLAIEILVFQRCEPRTPWKHRIALVSLANLITSVTGILIFAPLDHAASFVVSPMARVIMLWPLALTATLGMEFWLLQKYFRRAWRPVWIANSLSYTALALALVFFVWF